METEHNPYGHCCCEGCLGARDSDETEAQQGSYEEKPYYTDAQVINQIATNNRWSGTVITFGFLTSVPDWLQNDIDNYKGTVSRLPEREDVTFPIEEQLIVEFYSRV